MMIAHRRDHASTPQIGRCARRRRATLHGALAAVAAFALALAACGSSDAGSTATDPPGRVDQPQEGPPGVDGYGPSSPESCPDVAFPMTLQAEDAALEGVQVETQLAGYQGSGYVGGFGEVGDAVTFEFCVPEADYYTFAFRYANGSQERTSRTVFLDGEILPGDHEFTSRWSWESWEPVAASATLQDSALLDAGRHRLTVSFEPVDTGIMVLDEISIARVATPSDTSITSMLMNDWQDLVAGVFASRILRNYDTDVAPRVGELRGRANWQANNLDEAAGYLRDATAGTAYTEFDRRPLRTNIFTREDGVLEMDYLNWGDNPLPAAVRKEHAAPPESGLLVVRYSLTNVTPERRSYEMLEHVDLNRSGRQAGFDAVNPNAGPADVSGTMRVEWVDELQAFVADLSELHGTYVVFGSFQDPAQLATGPVGGGTVTLPGTDGDQEGETTQVASLVSQFSRGTPLTRVERFDGDDVEAGMVQTLDLDPGQTGSFSFFYAVRGSREEAEAAAREARNRSAEAWLQQTSQAWSQWLSQRETLPAEMQAGHDEAYKIALVSVKHTQQPEFGSFVAATNPAYEFKVWPRDASVVAMGLDAANYLDEAEAYWRWMADVQETGENEEFPVGTWWTNYSYWQKDEGIPFVQPEWDSLGLFTIGVYRHYLELLEQRGEQRAQAFFDEVWPAVQAASNFIAENVGQNGLGPQDFSIWESFLGYKTFTQVTYASGLTASYELAQVAREHGATVTDDDVESWRTAAQRIKAAILAPYDGAQCSGLWLESGAYFMRGIEPDCSADRTVDASTDLIWVFGLLDVEEEKARRHRQTVLESLSPNPYFQGISRFTDDTYYYSSVFSPGGPFESSVPETTWPQMSMYMAMGEHWLGLDALASARLDWYVSVTGVRYMPPGEGIDWAQQQPLMSTAVEPVTGTWYVLGLLVNAGRFEPRLSRVGPESGI